MDSDFGPTDPKTFLEADQSKDGDISLDEWRLFIETQQP
jgi:hypothetical protein